MIKSQINQTAVEFARGTRLVGPMKNCSKYIDREIVDSRGRRAEGFFTALNSGPYRCTKQNICTYEKVYEDIDNKRFFLRNFENSAFAMVKANSCMIMEQNVFNLNIH